MRPDDPLVAEAAKLALAGGAGGLVRWATLRSKWIDGVSGMLVGVLSSLYLSPVVEPLVSPTLGKLAPSSNPEGFAGFMVGLGGITLTGFLIDIFRFNRRRRTKDDNA